MSAAAGSTKRACASSCGPIYKKKIMLLRILAIQLLLILWPPYYLDKVWLRPKKHTLWRVVLWCVCVLLLTVSLVLTFTQDYSLLHARLTNAYLTLFMVVCIPWFFLALFAWLSRRFRSNTPRRMFLILGAMVSIGLFCTLVYGTLYGPRRLTVSNEQLTFASLPKAFNGYRIVHLSDFHLGSHASDTTFIRRVVDSVNARQPDLIVFTGDLVNFNVSELEPFIPVLKRLKARDGIYSVMGNHDYLMYHKKGPVAEEVRQLQAAQRRMGWHLLLNAHEFVRRAGDSIAVIGSENYGRPPFPAKGNLTLACKGLPEGIFKLLLTHDPYHWRHRVLPETDIALTLAGHTHGGQLRLFGWSPIKLVHKEWGGTYTEPGGAVLHISTGLGQALVAFRLGRWPQIDVLTLKTPAP